MMLPLTSRSQTTTQKEEAEAEKSYRISMATSGASQNIGRKKRKITSSVDTDSAIDFFDGLPADLVLNIISKLGATASCPSHFFNLILTSKRMNKLGFHPTVLSKISPNVSTCRARNWGPNAAKFLKLCAQASNREAMYTLGMISFYCYEGKNIEIGKNLIKRAAHKSHPDAIYTLSIMMFNGSGGTQKNPEGAIILAKQASRLGHIDATYELGLCHEEGHGVEQNVAEGRWLILQARVRLVASLLPADLGSAARILIPIPNTPSSASSQSVRWSCHKIPGPVTKPHPVRRFLTEWFGSRGGVPGEGRRLCSRVGCGLPETRVHEFRRCPICATVSYCSLTCQIFGWERHGGECTPMDIEEEGVNGDNADGGVDGEGNEEEEVGSEGDLEDQEEQI